MAERTERALRLKLHRINMQAAGLIVKPPTSQSNLNSILTTRGEGLAYEDDGDAKSSGGGLASMMGFGRNSGNGKLKKGSSGLGGGFSNMI